MDQNYESNAEYQANPLFKQKNEMEYEEKKEENMYKNEMNMMKNILKAQNENDPLNLKNNENQQGSMKKEDFEEREEEEERISLKWPEGIKNQAFYFIFFPINLFLLILPNYKNATPKKLAFSTIVYIVIVAVLLFFFSRCLQVVALGIKMSEQTMGLVFCALAISYPFIKYNLRIVKYDKENVIIESFLQIGIYKIGICIGVSWLFSCIIFLTNNINISNNLFRFGIVGAIFAGCLILTILATLGNKLKLSQGLSYAYLIGFVGFTISSICVLEIN